MRQILGPVLLAVGLVSWGCGTAINIQLGEGSSNGTAGEETPGEETPGEAEPETLVIEGTLEISSSASQSLSPTALVVSGTKNGDRTEEAGDDTASTKRDPAFYQDLEDESDESDTINTATSVAPAGIPVQLLDCDANVLDESETDEAGAYSLEILLSDWETLSEACDYLMPYAWVGSESDGVAISRLIVMDELAEGTDFSITPQTTLAAFLATQDSSAGDGEFDPRQHMKGMKGKKLADPRWIIAMIDKILERVEAMDTSSSSGKVCGGSSAKLSSQGSGSVLAMVRDLKKWIYQGTSLSDSRSAGQGMKAMAQLLGNLKELEACQQDIEGAKCESTLIVFLNKTFLSTTVTNRTIGEGEKAGTVTQTETDTSEDWEIAADDTQLVINLLARASSELLGQFLDAVRRDTTGYLPNLFLKCTEVAPLLDHTEDQAKIVYLHSIGDNFEADRLLDKLIMEDCVAYIVSLVDTGVSKTDETFNAKTTLTCGDASIQKKETPPVSVVGDNARRVGGGDPVVSVDGKAGPAAGPAVK